MCVTGSTRESHTPVAHCGDSFEVSPRKGRLLTPMGVKVGISSPSPFYPSFSSYVVSFPFFATAGCIEYCHKYSTRPLQPSRPRPRHPKSTPVSVSPLARNWYSYASFIAKSKAAYWLCFHQLGGHVEPPWLMCKYDVIHKSGST